MNGVIRELLSVSRSLIASSSEKEVERFLKAFLPGTQFRNLTFLVGGYVRDEILNIDAKDLDIVVNMKGGAERLTKQIHSLFSEETSMPRQMGAGYPVWQIVFKDNIEFEGKEYATSGAVIEFVDTQKESFPDEKSRQRVVEYGTLKEDIDRRDFTVNSLLKDLTTGEIVDLTGTSLSDIRNGVLRGNPGVDFDKVLRDDPLRSIRLVRFSVKYGWSIPFSTLKAVRRNASRIQIVSEERIRDELIKIMNLGKLHQAIRLMKTVGLLPYILPEIEDMRDVVHETSKGVHQEGSVYNHSMLVLKNSKPGVENQLAALLHDVGKPKTREIINGLVKFIGHEKVSGEMAEAILRRLKFDGSVIKKVRTMVENHMRPHSLSRDDSGPSAIRRFVRDVGVELVDSILDLAEADSLGNLPPENEIPDLRKKIEEVMEPVQQAEKLPIDGNDVQRILAVKPGRVVGEALKLLKDRKFEMAQHGHEMTKQEAENIVMEEFGQ